MSGTAQIAIDGYNVEVASFTRSRTAKINTYSIPNSYSDSLLPMSAQILSFKMDIKAHSDADYENIITLLSKPFNTITDIDGSAYSTRTVSINTNHIGGQVGYYDIAVEMVEKTLIDVGFVVWASNLSWDKILPYIVPHTKIVMQITDTGGTPAFTNTDLQNLLSTVPNLVLDVLIDTEPYYSLPAPLLYNNLYNNLYVSGPVSDSGIGVIPNIDIYDPIALNYFTNLGYGGVPVIIDYYNANSRKIAPYTRWCDDGLLANSYCIKTLPNGNIIKENPYDGYWYTVPTFNVYMHWYFEPRVIWVAINGTDISHPPPYYTDTKGLVHYYANSVGAAFLDLTI